MATQAVDRWFTDEVLPHERALTRFLRRHVADGAEVADLRQEIYVRLYEAATPDPRALGNVAAFAHTVARNLLIDRARRMTVISIEFATDYPPNVVPIEMLTPERHASSRDELRRFEEGLRRLPERCRQVVTLRKVEQLSQRECAERMGISEDTVERQVRQGMRALADFMLGGEGRIDRSAQRRRRTA